MGVQGRSRVVRRALLAGAAACILTLAGSAGFPVSAQELSVTGRVVDEGERPLAGAEVTLHAVPSRLERGTLRLAGRIHPEPADRAVTDDRGLFRLVAPETGLWNLVARAPGRVPVERAFHPLLGPTDLEPAVLLPSSGLAVQVVDESGEPLAGAPVTLWGAGPAERPSTWRRWSWQVAGYRAAVAGPEGRAMLPRLRGERGKLYAALPGHVEAMVIGQGEGPDRARLTLAPLPTRRLRMLFPDGRPAAGAVVWSRSPIPVGETGDDGTLAVPLPDGQPVRVHVDAADGWVVHAVVERLSEGEAGPQEAVLAPVPEVAGRVVEAEDGGGIAGALVWPGDSPEAVVRTDRRGAFRLPVLHGAQASVVAAAAPGFLGASWPLREGADAPGQTVVLELRPAAHLSGRVVDGEGVPLSRAAIEAAPSGHLASRGGSQDRPARARSGSGGRFRLEGLLPGEALWVRATLDGYAPWRELVPPSTAEREVLRGSFPELEVVLSAGITIRGRLVDEEGQPVAGAEVVVAPADARRERWGPDAEGTVRAVSGADGVFELTDLPAGPMDLEVVARGHAPLLRPGVEAPPRAEVRDLGDLVLGPEAALDGVVEDPAGAPVAGAEVRAMVEVRGAYRSARPGRREEDAPVTTGADGQFGIDGLRPGDTVELSVSKEGFATGRVRGVRPPTEDPLRVVLEPAAYVSGRVVDEAGRGVPNAHVTPSVVQPGWTTTHRPASAEEDGSFLAEVPPGAVHLSAGKRGYLPSAPVVLELASGERRDGVDLVLRPAAAVRGRVLASDGSPVPSAQVTITRFEEGGTTGLSEHADAEGRFELHSAPGRVRLDAWKEGFARTGRDFELGPEGATVELRLGRGTEVSGRVVGPDGAPVPGRPVMLGNDRSHGPRHEEVSAGDGSFRFRHVPDGSYRLLVMDAEPGQRRSGTPDAHPDPVEVHGGVPVEGLLVRLGRRVTLRGRLLGVEPEELARVTVQAQGREPALGWRQGGALDGGLYEVEGLEPGRWTVSAVVEGAGKRGQGFLEIGPGQSEVVLDLELREGLSVTGTVLWNGEPAAGVEVSSRHPPLGSGSRAVTGPGGRFELAGLAPGRQELLLSARERGFWTHRTVEVQGGEDLLLEVETARLRGTVLSSVGMEPIAEATVTLEGESGDERVQRRGYPTETAGDGTFLYEAIEPGVYRIRVRKSGYGVHASVVDVAEGEATLPPVVLEPTEALELRVRGADGTPLEQVGVRALDPNGVLVLDTWLRSAGEGRYRLESLPPGSWTLVVFGADGWAGVRTIAVSPGPAVEVVLPLGATLEIFVPSLAESQEAARVALTDDAGNPPPLLEPYGGEIPFAGGRMSLPSLTPGTWTVTVTAADGRTWSATVNLAPGGSARVELP